MLDCTDKYAGEYKVEPTVVGYRESLGNRLGHSGVVISPETAVQ